MSPEDYAEEAKKNLAAAFKATSQYAERYATVAIANLMMAKWEEDHSNND